MSDEINREELKKWTTDKINELCGSNVSVVFGRKNKKWHGVTKTVMNNNGEKSFRITIHKGTDLEELKDELDVDMFKDTVVHEACHVLAGKDSCTYHSGHDKLWKHFAVDYNVLPSGKMNRLSYRLWKEGIKASILGTPVFVRLEVFKRNGKTFHFGLELEPFHRAVGSVILHCDKCGGYWVRGSESLTHYCAKDEVEVSVATPTKEEIKNFNTSRENVSLVEEDEE